MRLKAVSLLSKAGRTLTTSAEIRPVKQVTSRELGYICPNGNINFQTTEAAVEYAKNRCSKAAKEGYELGGFRHKNTIILERRGDAESVDFGKKLNIPSNSECFHGHLGKKATPISLEDYKLLMSKPEISSIVAYDSRGAYSKLVKTAEAYGKEAETIIVKDNCFKQFLRNLFNLPKKRTIIVNKHIRLSRECEKEFFEKVIGEKNIQKLDEISNILDKIEKGVIQCTKEEFQALEKLEHSLLQESQAYEKIHEFWVNNASKYGVKYSTNFRHLK